MNTKTTAITITNKEFNNIWFRTGRDPDGNDMPTIIFGGQDDSYGKYLKNKQNQYQYQTLITKSTTQTQSQSKQVEFKSADSPPQTSDPSQPQNPITNNPLQSQQAKQPYIWHAQGSKTCNICTSKDGQTFDWNDTSRPGNIHPNCNCYAEFVDSNGNPTGKYGRVGWPEKGTESHPKPYFEPSDKNGKPLNEKPWNDLTSDEKEQRKQEELDKFKNSDKLKENISQTVNMLPGQWINSVRPHGRWDYKQGGKASKMEHVGNFNYGATGRAAGYAGDTLLRAGGIVQTITGTSRSEFGSPLDNTRLGNNDPSTSYRDDPRDQEKIQDGINWYNENYE